MNPSRKNSIVRRELDVMLRLGLIDETVHRAVAPSYATGAWDWRSLGRWFLIFGAVSVAAGIFILLKKFFHFTYAKLAVILSVAGAAAFFGAYLLKRRGFPMAGKVTELLGGFIIIGLTFTLGIIFSTGSGNWPALLLIDLVLLVPLAYLLNNALLLVLSAVLFFTWFGGVTGYASGWGMYWFGMNYPLRFLGIAGVIIGLAVVHLEIEKGFFSRYRGFFKVWLSTGLFFGEMALWLLSLFGNFGDIDSWHIAETGELVLFNFLWAVASGLLLFIGIRKSVRMLVGYGATFLIIQIYTLFFAHVADKLDPFLALFLVGSCTLGLVMYVERLRRARRQDR